jgi:hypothetical protein
MSSVILKEVSYGLHKGNGGRGECWVTAFGGVSGDCAYRVWVSVVRLGGSVSGLVAVCLMVREEVHTGQVACDFYEPSR